MGDASDASQRAEGLKANANKLYTAGDLKEAAKLYEQAYRLWPKPVYLSNLSAAQYELGAYEESLSTITKARALVDDDLPAWTKLCIRSIKCHLQLRNWDAAIEQVEEALARDISKDAKETAVGFRRLVEQAKEASRFYGQDEALCKRAIVDLPRYRPSPVSRLEYFTTGHDVPCSIMTAQGIDVEPTVVEEKRMRMEIPSDGRPFEFSALFGGIGDARHFFATLWDIGNQLALRRVKPMSALRMHFTLVDIHPTAIARDLIVLYSLDELARMDDTRFKSPRARLLLNMLHFLYWCTVMPPSLYDAMLEKIRVLHKDFSAAAASRSAMTKDWLYVDREAVKPVLESLEWWLGDGQTRKSVTQMLPRSIEGGSATAMSGGNPHIAAWEKEREEAELEAFMSDYNTPEGKELLKVNAAKWGVTPEKLLQELKEDFAKNPTASASKYANNPDGCREERMLFDTVKVLWPAQDVDEPQRFKKAIELFPSALSGDPLRGGRLVLQITETISTRVRDSWKPNITYLDRNYDRERDHSAFEQMYGFVTSSHLQPHLPRRASRLSDYSDSIFSHTARSIRRLLQVGQGAFVTELLVGDVWKVAEGISMGTLERDGLPELYDRIHLSNVPDYTGGHASIFPIAMPLLKRHRQAYVTATCLLNTGLFGRLGPNGDPLECVDAYVFQYAATTRARLPAMFGVEAVNQPRYLGSYTTYAATALPPSHAQNRDELSDLLYGLFMRCMLPAPFENPGVYMTPREGLNVHALFRLLRVLGRIHPGHLLGDFVMSIVENKVTTGVELHEYSPIPVPKRPPARKHGVNCLPFQAEFEVACAVWAPLLPFPLPCRVLPLSDIATYSIPFHMFDPQLMEHLGGNKMALILVIGSRRELENDLVISQLRRRVWSDTQPQTTINLISSFQWQSTSETAHVLLPKSRLASFKDRGLYCALISTVLWRIASSVEPCQSIRLTGDAHKQSSVAL